MGKPCFSGIIKFFAVALLGAAAAITAIAVLSSPATAKETAGGGGGRTLKSWDTDNLRYGRYNAKSFNIPFHDYSGYSGVEACRSGVADGFFQTGSPDDTSTTAKEDELTPEDFPVLAFSNGSWSVEAETSTTNSSGCDDFVAQQNKMATQIAANGGYYLDASGKLRHDSSVPARFSGRTLSYTYWGWKDGNDFVVRGGSGAVRKTSGYLDRVDYGGKHAIYPAGTSLTVPETTTDGNFGSPLHGTVSRGFVRVAVPDGGVASVEYLPYASGLCPAEFHPRGEDSYERIGGSTGRTLGGVNHSVGKTADKYWCRSDVRYLRSFKAEHHTSLGWNRAGQQITRRSDAVTAGSIFAAYGRLNCYFTSTSTTELSNGGYVCGYYYPLPQCTDNGRKRDFAETELEEYSIGASFTAPEDGSAACAEPPRCTANGRKRDFTDAELKEYTDEDSSFKPAADGTTPCVKPATPKCTDNGRKRDFTDAELAAYRRDDPSFTPAAGGTTPCRRPNTPQLPPSLPGFSDDACVTANLQIYENRTAGSDAAPGVTATDRTLAAATGRTAWDLDITSPHPLTASPPRATGDASGCTDGSESRADHAATSGGAARSQSTAPSYASSSRTDTAAPPNDADGDIDYTGAVKNIAHRYASKVAENTCAVKRAEVILRLEMLESEANIYKDWMARYRAWASGMETGFSEWLNDNPALSTSSADNATFGSYKHAVRRGLRRTYASGMETFYAGRKNRSASVAGRSLTKPAVGSSWCGDVSSLISSYASSVGSLKTAATDVLTYGSAPTNPGSGPSAPVVSPPSAPTAGYVSSSTEGTEPQDAVTETTNYSSSFCYTSSPLPESFWFGTTYITYTYGGTCTRKGTGKDKDKTFSGTTVRSNYSVTTVVTPAVAEVKATATATYNSYPFRISSGTWSKTARMPAATGAATCNTWRTSSCYVSGSHPLHSGNLGAG